ncbi:MOSC domain-containing protein [Actinosynnema sp. NPDC020468]|uniref:MOSC domain-containing protein n=1 Tax=Actinosynnema sp. NPDC020468 TaxID=3154488 RepID=UPI0033E8BC64
MAHVLSLNVGSRVETDKSDLGHTGIGKQPVSGPVEVRAPGPRGEGGSGLVTDHVSDLRFHGGDDQAVYAYAREDLDEWGAELERDLPPGLFGENLTTAGVDLTNALIGERWRIGDALLRVTSPRIPCMTFVRVMGVKGWMKKFIRRAVPGAYFAVVESGRISPGDGIEVVDRPDHKVTVGLTFRALTLEADRLPDLLPASADLPKPVLERIERRDAYGAGVDD